MALATIQRFFCSKDEMSTKGFLGVKADTSGDEERIELLDALEVVIRPCLSSLGMLRILRHTSLTRRSGLEVPTCSLNMLGKLLIRLMTL